MLAAMFRGLVTVCRLHFQRFRHVRLIACLAASFASLAPLAGGCKSKEPAAVVQAAEPRAFELSAPPGYREVAPGPLAGAWEAAALSNGFQPTLNVTRRSRPAGTTDENYATWRDELLAVMRKQYGDVKVLAERPLAAGPLTGKLIILVCTLPIPGNPTPMPLFVYGTIFDPGDTLWVMGAITGAELDAKTGTVTALHEAEILNALSSFRLR